MIFKMTEHVLENNLDYHIVAIPTGLMLLTVRIQMSYYMSIN